MTWNEAQSFLRLSECDCGHGLRVTLNMHYSLLVKLADLEHGPESSLLAITPLLWQKSIKRKEF